MFVHLCSGKVLELPNVTSFKFEAGFLMFYERDAAVARFDRREILYCSWDAGCPIPC